MNKATVINLRSAIEIALKAVEVEHGVTINLGSARYDESSVKFQFSAVDDITTASGETIKTDRFEVNFKANCYKWGLKPTDLGKTFLSNGKMFKITGSKSRNHRYPILASRVSDGSSFKFTSKLIKDKLNG